MVIHLITQTINIKKYLSIFLEMDPKKMIITIALMVLQKTDFILRLVNSLFITSLKTKFHFIHL